MVAAESMIAIDFLPHSLRTNLIKTNRPIGEAIIDSRLENFKEATSVWMLVFPGWLMDLGCEKARSRIIARRYRIIVGGQPIMVITEYFLRDEFYDLH